MNLAMNVKVTARQPELNFAPAVKANQFVRTGRPARPDSRSRQETVFRLAADAAKNVLLAADFTEWNKAPLKMNKAPDGVWQVRVSLKPGRYRYQFLIDLGTQNVSTVRRPPAFGTLHGVVDVTP
jgi:1,4-alpha-glucan branching enzyme